MSYSTKLRIVQFCVLVSMTLATFAPVLSNQFFTLDDPDFIEANEVELPLSTEEFLAAWSRTTLGLYVPVPNLSFALIANLSASGAESPSRLGFADYPDQRFDPRAFHAASLGLHVIAGLLVYGSLLLLGVSSWGAFLGSGVFLVHPVQVEGLAWASLLKDLLATTFGCAAILLYLIHATASKWTTGGIAYAFAFFFYLLALVSKPGAIMLSVILFLIGLVALDRSPRKLLGELIPWAVCAVPVVIVTSTVQLGETAAMQFELLGYHSRPLIALDSISFYLAKLAAPLELAFDYGRSPRSALDSAWLYVTWVPPILIAALAYARRREAPWLVVSYGIFLLGLVPTLGLRSFSFQTFSTVTDHYLSLSMIGVAIGLGGSFDAIASRMRSSTVSVAIGLAILGAYGLKSHAQVGYWKNSETIYRHAIEVNPKSWIAYRMLGHEEEVEHRPDAALELYRKSMSINGNTYGHSSLFDKLMAAEDFERARVVISDVIEVQPRDIDYLTRADLNYRMGRIGDSMRDLEDARRLDPSPEMSERIDRALRNLRAARKARSR